VNAIEALRNVRLEWDSIDAWRIAYPNEKEFTYRANTIQGQIKARLDRIYTSRPTSLLIYDWTTTPSPVPTDHWLVVVKYAPKEAPEIGKGRWTLPILLLRNEKFLKDVTTRGMELQRDLDRIHQFEPDRDSENPQSAWATFKEDVRKIA
jgi:hypothetical protein